VVSKLGNLEAQVMEVLWQVAPEVKTVREVGDHFPDHAYTTIMTVLTRLASKGFILEGQIGRAKTYVASMSKAEFISTLMTDALDLASDRTAALVQFARTVDAEGARALRDALQEPRP